MRIETSYQFKISGTFIEISEIIAWVTANYTDHAYAITLFKSAAMEKTDNVMLHQFTGLSDTHLTVDFDYKSDAAKFRMFWNEGNPQDD